MGKTARFKASILNGNFAPLIVPHSDMGTISGLTSTHPFIETNTRTIFKDVMGYGENADTIKEYIASPDSRQTAPSLREGHFPMTQFAPTDPRIQHCHTSPDLGPGTFNLDSLHIPYKADPTRSSPEFISPPRGTVNPETPSYSAADPLPLDFDSWTSKGFYFPQSLARSPQKVMTASPDVTYDNAANVAVDGRSASLAASLAISPGSKSSFQSALPRLQDPASTTSAAIAPGVYVLDPPRFRSFNQAYIGTAPLESLGSLSSDVNLEQNISRPLSPIKMPPPVISSQGLGAVGRSAPNSPQRLPSTLPKFDDWRHHEALTRSHFSTGLTNDQEGRGDKEASLDQALEDTNMAGLIDDARIAECSAQMRAQLFYTASYGAAAAQLRQQKFGQLAFAKRDTPHKILIRTKIQVKEDVRAARAGLKGEK
jgi:hypothetical protein